MSKPKIVETRKVQKFGKSTLMISLPSEWVRIIGLKPSDLVRLEAKEDGSLVIIPQQILEKKSRGKEIKIVISSTTSEDILQRSIYALYIAGYDRIVIESSEGRISHQHMHSLRTLIRMLIGAEIVEQTTDRVAIQIFIDTERYSIDGLIARMISSIKSMLEFLLSSIKTLSPEHLKEISEIEFEMDRVHALAVRYVNVLNILGATPFLTEYRALIKSIEDIGDALTQASQVFIDRPDLMEVIRNYIGEKLDELKLHISYTLDILLESLVKGDIFMASRAIDLAIEAIKFVSKMETDVVPKYKSLDEYLRVKSFFERLLLICYNLQTASELGYDIAIGKHEETINIVATIKA
ncbi:phosphate uptake regulator, PhoU [Ignisphaera aggregans DSM 17230]|uniref:Phosphate uptake regulator, PhoU n=1 Tax=Ignisphaera aggregans (strain DSM 17230 / JCM 13409 / AQ1.S1) TaxID=583356 RepID=E0SNX5_IGNAA|nr:phosphate uptake regulator, PhoU [Ignisphaera aggregans DSM 17230]